MKQLRMPYECIPALAGYANESAEVEHGIRQLDKICEAQEFTMSKDDYETTKRLHVGLQNNTFKT